MKSMKKISILSVLVAALILLAGGIVAQLITNCVYGYNPDRYLTLGQYKNLTVTLDGDQTDEENKTQTIRDELWQMLVDGTSVKGYPTKEMESQKAEFIAQVEAEAKDWEMPFSDYISLGYGAKNQEEFDAFATEYCQMIVKQEMILKSLCKKEHITLTDEEYEQYYNEYLTAYQEVGATEEEMIAQYGTKEDFYNQFLMEKAVDLMEKTATVNQETKK
jgi:FKBP-type peptidyl-prolyl cis-trans isomerase (trigger factor)